MTALPYLLPGCRVIRVNSGRRGGVRMTSEKVPDLIGVQRLGAFIAIEVKTEDGQLEEHQYEFLRDTHERGAYAGLFTPSGLFRFLDMPEKHMTPSQREKHRKWPR
jgi:hypothetical protein